MKGRGDDRLQLIGLAELPTIPQATWVRKAATASSSVPYTLSILSRLVRRSTSLTRLLGDTNLSSPPRFLVETESPARIPSPPLSMWCTPLRLITILGLPASMFPTLSRKAAPSSPNTMRPWQRRMNTSPDIWVCTLKAIQTAPIGRILQMSSDALRFSQRDPIVGSVQDSNLGNLGPAAKRGHNFCIEHLL